MKGLVFIFVSLNSEIVMYIKLKNSSKPLKQLQQII